MQGPRLFSALQQLVNSSNMIIVCSYPGCNGIAYYSCSKWDGAVGGIMCWVQVSRLFSALLQLANNGNIIILRSSEPSQAFQLRLASLERKHQHFQDYRAPSFLQIKVPSALPASVKILVCPSAQRQF